MAKRPKLTIQDIVQLQKENEELERDINILRMENFDYCLKINHLENILSNVETLSRSHSGKLLQASENLCTVLQISKIAAPVLPSHNNSKKNVTPEKQNVGNKAHIIKPHMVNGHVLYRPTVNLTRVSDMQVNSQRVIPDTQTLSISDTLFEQDEAGPSNEQMSANSDHIEDSEQDAQLSAILEENENQNSHIEHVSEQTSSRSPSHSTVLSGTFQEVKIYLNQISPDKHVEKGRKSSKRPMSRTSRSSFGAGSSGHVTTRKKRS